MNKKKLFMGNLSIELEKRQWVVECGVVCIRNMVNDSSRQRLEAMEMWIWRRMEKISWVDKISNEEVLQRINETKTMLDTVRKHKCVVRACAKT